jgi:hypothetical protein
MTATQVDPRNEHYQIATVEILQEIPARYIRQRKLDYDESLEMKKVQAQNRLNELGCTLVAQNLLSSPRKKIFDAALRLIISLLEGGNKQIQDKLEAYFYSIREERFFYSFHKRLLRGVNTCKDAQATLTRKTYKMNRQQCIVDQPLLYKTGKRPASISSAVRKRTSSFSMRLLQQRNPGWHSERNDVYRDISQCMISCEINSEYGIADYPAMIDTMRALQLMVEGHNLQLQTYLAKQPDNIKSFNIVLDVIDYFHSVVPICHRQSISLIMQVLDTITELAQVRIYKKNIPN